MLYCAQRIITNYGSGPIKQGKTMREGNKGRSWFFWFLMIKSKQDSRKSISTWFAQLTMLIKMRCSEAQWKAGVVAQLAEGCVSCLKPWVPFPALHEPPRWHRPRPDNLYSTQQAFVDRNKRSILCLKPFQNWCLSPPGARNVFACRSIPSWTTGGERLRIKRKQLTVKSGLRSIM